jgi:hypothetical protein
MLKPFVVPTSYFSAGFLMVATTDVQLTLSNSSLIRSILFCPVFDVFFYLCMPHCCSIVAY